MLKKIARDILILFGIAALWVSTSRNAMQYISDKRKVDKWWGIYPRSHGNLISRTYLDFVKTLNPGPDLGVIKRAPAEGPKNVGLYIYGDSYTWDLADTAFTGLPEFHHISRYSWGFFHLDTNKTNILVIQYSERSVRGEFGDLRIFDGFRDSTKKVSLRHSPTDTKKYYASLLPDFKLENIFNKNINQNLQFNLFNYQFIIPMFEFKAAITYYCFKRASGDATLSKDGNYLFLKETVAGEDPGSSYMPLPPSEVAHLVDNFNAIYDHYKAAGFAEVYLSMVPNTSSMVQPDGYNNLIPLVQNDPRLRMRIIDAYSFLKRDPGGYFYHGDTHWNMKARQIWVDMVNDILTQLNKSGQK